MCKIEIKTVFITEFKKWTWSVIPLKSGFFLGYVPVGNRKHEETFENLGKHMMWFNRLRPDNLTLERKMHFQQVSIIFVNISIILIKEFLNFFCKSFILFLMLNLNHKTFFDRNII